MCRCLYRCVLTVKRTIQCFQSILYFVHVHTHTHCSTRNYKWRYRKPCSRIAQIGESCGESFKCEHTTYICTHNTQQPVHQTTLSDWTTDCHGYPNLHSQETSRIEFKLEREKQTRSAINLKLDMILSSLRPPK